MDFSNKLLLSLLQPSSALLVLLLRCAHHACRNEGVDIVTDIVAVSLRFAYDSSALEIALPAHMDMQEAYTILENAHAAERLGKSRVYQDHADYFCNTGYRLVCISASAYLCFACFPINALLDVLQSKAARWLLQRRNSHLLVLQTLYHSTSCNACCVGHVFAIALISLRILCQQFRMDSPFRQHSCVCRFCTDVFQASNRMGDSGALLRISALRNTYGKLCRLTYGIGRHFEGAPTS